MFYRKLVLVSSIKVAKELLSKTECLNRPTNGVLQDRMLHQNIGMVFSNNRGWTEIRNFTKKSLRQFGFGNKTAMGKLIKEELKHLVNKLQDEAKNSDGVIFFDKYFQPSFLNLISSMITGKRADYNDEELLKLLNASNLWFDTPMLGVLTVMAFPFTRFICPGLLGYTQQINALKMMHSYAKVITRFLLGFEVET